MSMNGGTDIYLFEFIAEFSIMIIFSIPVGLRRWRREIYVYKYMYVNER